ncbi:hypothetical protein BMS3Bbin04_00471 [bacterium BMS3Bbin04]|nr:hypothetical protein BMS3Bbin04_00471 [bacterium BMS3Bbin04]
MGEWLVDVSEDTSNHGRRWCGLICYRAGSDLNLERKYRKTGSGSTSFESRRTTNVVAVGIICPHGITINRHINIINDETGHGGVVT